MQPLQYQIDERIVLKSPEHRFQTVIPKIPTNTIIHKTITGVGATTCEIEYDRHSILVFPNIATIENKQAKHSNSLAVHETTSMQKVSDYVRTTVGYQKILTTPESLSKVIDACKSNRINPYEKYFILLDEAHKFIQDKGYRPRITRAMDFFFSFTNKAMISATPIIPSDPRFAEKVFKVIKIEPAFKAHRPVELFLHNNLLAALKQMFKRHQDGQHCIFFNMYNKAEKKIIKEKLERLKRDNSTIAANLG